MAKFGIGFKNGDEFQLECKYMEKVPQINYDKFKLDWQNEILNLLKNFFSKYKYQKSTLGSIGSDDLAQFIIKSQTQSKLKKLFNDLKTLKKFENDLIDKKFKLSVIYYDDDVEFIFDFIGDLNDDVSKWDA